MRKRYPLYEGSSDGIVVTAVARHRNGVGGLGFYAVELTYEGTEYIATLDDNGRVQLVNPADIEDTMRGHDYFGQAVRRAVVEWYDATYDASYEGFDAEKDVPQLRGA